jgi:putative transposase
MLLERGIAVSYETIRRWAIKFGSYAAAKREVMPKVEHRSHRDSTIWRRILTVPSESERG